MKFQRLAHTVWIIAVILGPTYWLGAMARSGVAFQSLATLSPALVVGWKMMSTLMLALAAWVTAWLVATSKPTILLALAYLNETRQSKGGSILTPHRQQYS